MDESVLRNLDTQHRRLNQIEAEVERLLAGAEASGLAAAPSAPEGYAALTATNDVLRADRGWTSVDLNAASLDRLTDDLAQSRLSWDTADVVAVGLAGAVGAAATWFDTTIDFTVRRQLRGLKDTELVSGWEKAGTRLSIDYTGPGFGGPLHRVKSAGHDIGRPFAALDQIRRGEFRGVVRENGALRTVVETTGFRPVEGFAEALAVWSKHLAADVVTPMSVPLPGFSWLYESSHQDLHTFAYEAYRRGVNIRSEVLKALPMLTTEVIVRTHLHGRAMHERGTPVLTPQEETLRSELLLAGHALVGAVSLGKALARALVVSAAPPAAAAVAFRHINWPVLTRAAVLSAQVARDARRRTASEAPSWDDLLSDLAGPWQLDEAVLVDECYRHAVE